MKIRNIMEDIVYASVLEVLKNEEMLQKPEEYVEDICAYVLNRIAPKYATTEQGVLHGLLDAKFSLQQRTDVIMLTYEAIEVISERHKNSDARLPESDLRNLYLPHIIGEVVEETSFSLINDVVVTLLYKDKPMPMASEGWKNPFFTNSGTRSYYHFWPLVPEGVNQNDQLELILRFEHKLFISKEYSFSITPVEKLNTITSKAVNIVLLQLKEGQEEEFFDIDE